MTPKPVSDQTMKKWLLFLVLSISSMSANADSPEMNAKFCDVLGNIAQLSATLRDVGLSEDLTLAKINSLNTAENTLLRLKIKRSSMIIVEAVYQEKAKVLIPEQLKRAVIESCLTSF